MRHQQLSLFTGPATAAVRDRTKARNYSPGKDEFRRDHARRRKWGLARRHGAKLCRSRGCSPECARLGLHDQVEAVPPLIWPDEATCTRPSPATSSDTAPAADDLPSDTPRPAHVPVVTGQASPQPQVMAASEDEPAPHAEPAPCTQPAPDDELAPEDQPARRAHHPRRAAVRRGRAAIARRGPTGMSAPCGPGLRPDGNASRPRSNHPAGSAALTGRRLHTERARPPPRLR
jgi:hypothetical protein